MGAWGHNAFENDDALDFIAALESKGDANAAFGEVFKSILSAESPDASLCSSAIAAAEIIAKANGHPSRGVPDAVSQWLNEHGFRPAKSLTTKAMKACRKILQSSELKNLWENAPSWKKSVGRTVGRLERPSNQAAVKATSKRQRGSSEETSNVNKIGRIKQSCVYVQFKKRKPVYAAINVNKLNAELIADLKTTPSITHLDFSGVIENGTNPFDDLAQVTQLEILHLNECQGLRDVHLRFCSRLPNLMSLNLSDQEITDHGLAHLKSCKSLEVLNVDGTLVTDVGLEAACHGKNIWHFSAVRTPLTGKGFQCFPDGTLQHINLEASQLSDEGLGYLSQVSRNAKTLSLAHCAKVTDAGLSHLTSFKTAEQLWLGGPNLSGTGFAFLEQMACLKYLFVFESTQNFCKNVVQHLKKSNVEHVQLSGPFDEEDLSLLASVSQLTGIALVGSLVPSLYASELAKARDLQIEITS